MPMRILVVQGGRNDELPSGEQVVISREVNSLRSDGHFVHLDHGVRLPSGGVARFLCRISGIIWSRANHRHVINLIQTYKPDIIHFHSIVPYLSLSVLYAAHRNEIPIVQTLHNGRWLCIEGGYYRDGHFCDDCVGTRGWRGVVRGCGHGRIPALVLFLVNLYARSSGRIFSWIGRFIAVSGFVYQQHVKSGFPAEKITIRNNGVDTSTIDFQSGTRVDRKGVAFAGRISEAKGSKVLLHLIKNIKEPLQVVGSGPDLGKLESFCREEGFQHVTFWGNQPHEKVMEILGSTVCTVVPSQCGESFPTVATESMVLGTPVVASDLGGLSQLIADSGGGIVVAPGALDDFVDTISLLLNSSEKASSMGQLGMRYVREHLASEEKSKELVAIYQEVITGAMNNDHQL